MTYHMACNTQLDSFFGLCTAKNQGLYPIDYRSTFNSWQQLENQSLQAENYGRIQDERQSDMQPFRIYDSMQQILNNLPGLPSGNLQPLDLQLLPVLSSAELVPLKKSNGQRREAKNSNAVKKIGRIILNNLQKFKLRTGENRGVRAMLDLFKSKAKQGAKIEMLKDMFNFSHLKALLFECSASVCSSNLRVTRRLFSKLMRKEILSSVQIKKENQLLYLNTLKSSGLRFCNKKLALRLQLSRILQ